MRLRRQRFRQLIPRKWDGGPLTRPPTQVWGSAGAASLPHIQVIAEPGYLRARARSAAAFTPSPYVG